MKSQWPAGVPATMAGALKFPAFLLLWSVGLLLATGAVLPADALVRKGPVAVTALPQVPSLADQKAFGAALEAQLSESAVVSGAWQPRVAPPPAIAPELVVKAPRFVKVARTETAPQLESAPRPESSQLPEEAWAPEEESPRLSKTPPLVAGPVILKTQPEPAGPELEAAGAGFSMTRVTEGPADRTSPAPTLRAASAKVLDGARRALAQGKFGAAYRLLMGEVEGAASHPVYLGVLAVSALALGRDAEALLVYERLTQLAPDDGRWWAGAALSRERLGLEATVQFAAALELAGDDETLHALASTRLKDLG